MNSRNVPMGPQCFSATASLVLLDFDLRSYCCSSYCCCLFDAAAGEARRERGRVRSALQLWKLHTQGKAFAALAAHCRRRCVVVVVLAAVAAAVAIFVPRVAFRCPVSLSFRRIDPNAERFGRYERCVLLVECLEMFLECAVCVVRCAVRYTRHR